MPEIRRGPYTVERSPAAAVPLETHRWRFKTSIVTTWCSWLLYIVIQYGFASLMLATAPRIIWRVRIILLAELVLTFQDAVTALNIILALFSVNDTVPRPSYRLTGNQGPSVDVLVTCCGEPIDVIVNTVAAAASQDYPLQQLRVFLLDDGHNQGLQQAVMMLNTRLADRKKTQVVYLSRRVEAGAKSYFKAGNLRYGIDESHRQGSSELLAGLDADMIPRSDWLRKMVPHLLLDDRLALACPPQRYYNVTASDPLGQQADFDMYFTVQEVLNDGLGAAMCTGSGYVVRRDALDEIGGWPLAETGEDFMCSALLSDVGWKIAFIRENIQSGLAPENIRAVVKQRMRWIDACIEVCQYFRYYLPGSAVTSQMTMPQRIVNMLYALRDYSPLMTTLALMILPMALWPTHLDQTDLISSKYPSSLLWLRMSFVTTFLLHKINSFIMYKHIGLSRVANFQSHEVWIAPYMAYRCLITLLPATMRTSSFAVCGAITSAANERSRRHRKRLPYRVFSPDMLMYTIYAIYASTPIVLRLVAYTQYNDAPRSLFLFPGPMIKLLACIWKVLVPVRYMIWPPTVPDRNELVEEDEMGVKRPRKDWEKDVVGNGIWWTSLTACELCVIWLCVIP